MDIYIYMGMEVLYGYGRIGILGSEVLLCDYLFEWAGVYGVD